MRVSDAGINLSDNEPVAIKLESARCRFPQLAYEYKLYKILQAGGMLFDLFLVALFPRVFARGGLRRMLNSRL